MNPPRLTDEQLRVLCAEADGWKEINPRTWSAYTDTYQTLCSPADDIAPGAPAKFYGYAPDYLHDANAAMRLLKGKVWSSHTSGSATSISVDCIQVEDGIVAATVSGSDVPAFCRAIVLSFLRAEGKIL